MRVLWFSCTPSCYDVKINGGWVEALERIVRQYLPDIELGVVFEHNDCKFKEIKNGVTYYPLNVKWSLKERFFNKFTPTAKKSFLKLKPLYLRAVEDFKPDIIQCFGTELWHYSLLQKEISIPFVIHIMGFWHAIQMADDTFTFNKYNTVKSWNFIKNLRLNKNLLDSHEHLALERMSMECCRYYMGRTTWDKDIVNYCSDKSKYYYCPEAIRASIFNSSLKWKYIEDETIRLITISNAGKLKGNEIILKTAWILKNHFNKKVDWKYTTTEERILKYENKTGIKCKEVGINLIGRLTSSEIPNALCSAQIFVHPSIIENSSNAVCEAQLLGVPIIASNVGGMPQIIEHGVTGLLYPYNEPYALAVQILNLHNNEVTLNELSNNSYKVAHQRHDPETISRILNDIYCDIIDDYNNVLCNC